MKFDNIRDDALKILDRLVHQPIEKVDDEFIEQLSRETKVRPLIQQQEVRL